MLRYAVLLGRALSSRAVKVTLYLWILVWGLDRAIFWATEAAWFGSVGQGAWFGARFWAQFALFWTTLALALASATLAMRVAARPAPGAELRALPVAFERLEPLRRSASRLAWLALVVGAWGVARQMAGGWDVFLSARAAPISDPIWGLPLARLVLGCLWRWTLILLGALAFAGGLRALPLLAARQPVAPLRLWRALGALGALALLARSALYGVSWGEALWSDGTTGAELFIGLPLAVVGAALCWLAAFWCLKRPALRRLGIAVALALFAPHLLRVLLAPLALIVPTPASVEARNLAHTRAGWSLDNAPIISAKAPPLVGHWPIWNEEALLGLTRAEMPRRGQQIINWQRASVGPREAIVVGAPAGLENWGAPHEADAPNGIEWLAFDATQSVDGLAPARPDASLPLLSFYGLGGRALLGDSTAQAGVPFAFWGWKFAWAWRLRDPLLMLEGARAGRLLVFRGARESAERLAPFLVWDEAQLRTTADGPRWQLVGYAATPYYRGALAASDGVFAAQNAAAPAVVLQIDPRNGRADFFGPRGSSWSRTWAEVAGASLVEESLIPLPATPLLDEARAQMARQLGTPNVLAAPVWTWSQGSARKVSLAANWPAGVAGRLALLDNAARREWPAQEGAELQSGDAAVWPDARAPGGFWVGRPYYTRTKTAGATSAGQVARGAKLWRVALTAITDSPVAQGENTAAALVDFDLKNAPATPAPGALSPASAKSGSALALEALRAHDAAQKAAANSNWDEWDKLTARERKLLEQLAALKAKN